jgi:hypothetical protein
MWKYVVGITFFAIAAVGLGLYVFPEQPWIGWALLFFCWGCYRLKMRADRLFGERRARAQVENFPISGTKGGARRGTAVDPTLQRYLEWHANDPQEPEQAH